MPDKFYTKENEWVEMGQDGLATIGITAHAQAALGEVQSVQLPDPGRSVAKGEACAVVEGAHATNISAPLTGTIAEHNPAIIEDPGLINKDPEGEAWFFKMRLADPTAFTELMDKPAYDEFLANLP